MSTGVSKRTKKRHWKDQMAASSPVLLQFSFPSVKSSQFFLPYKNNVKNAKCKRYGACRLCTEVKEAGVAAGQTSAETIFVSFVVD
jgi:hypothetical protein